MPSCAASPLPSSMTYFASAASRGISSSGRVGATTATFAKTRRTVPSAPTKIMSSGTSVSFIQNATWPSLSKTKIIPVFGASTERFINPCSRIGSVRATSSVRSARGACTTIVDIVAASSTAALNTLERFLAHRLDVVPAVADFEGDLQRNGQGDCVFHVFADKRRHPRQVVLSDFENKLVVYLQQHRRVQFCRCERSID